MGHLWVIKGQTTTIVHDDDLP